MGSAQGWVYRIFTHGVLQPLQDGQLPPGVRIRSSLGNEAVWGKDSEYPYPRHRDMIRRIYERFGAKVMLWGADMPWAQRACTYKQCIDTIRHHTEFMTDEDRGLVLGGNAARIYRIPSHV